MVPKGSSPETYDPTPQQLVDLAQSKAYFRIGYIGFEQTWTEKLTDNAPHLQFFDMSENVELILDDTHAHHHKDGHVHEGHTHAGGVEPHIWNSTINAQIIAGDILNALCTIDKANENTYMERYNALIRRIEHTDSLICQMLSSPNADRAFMIYHPALSYFARDYNLHQIPIEAGGKEPSPAHLKNLINSCKKEKVRVIFVQPEFDRRNADLIAQQTGTRVVAINPLSYCRGDSISLLQENGHPLLRNCQLSIVNCQLSTVHGLLAPVQQHRPEISHHRRGGHPFRTQ